jgi:hypothetical protein
MVSIVEPFARRRRRDGGPDHLVFATKQMAKLP